MYFDGSLAVKIAIEVNMLLQINSAEFRFGENIVFRDVNLDVNEGDRIGIVGPNGSGKSTLLNCLTGELQLFAGTITRRNGITVGYLHQNCDFVSTNTLFEEMMSVFAGQRQLLDQLHDVATQMSLVAPDTLQYRQLADKYQRLTVEADVSEAYNIDVKVKTVLNGMGMAEFSDRIVSTLSGGEKTKAALCKLLLQQPDLMILDEPTNHLDYKTLDWLEGFLSDKKSTLLVVSHDRYFLDKLCSTIWHVQHGRVVAFRGNYSKYKVLLAEQQKLKAAQWEKQQREVAKLQDYIARNKVRASTADMAKSREKALGRMEIVEAPLPDERPPRFVFGYSSEPSEFPLTVKGLSLGFEGKPLLECGELQLHRGQKMALLGLNGVGKSTLIKRLAAAEPCDIGKIIFGKNVRVGYYDQENLNLDAGLRVIDQLWFDNTRMSQTQVRGLLAQVTLGADDAFKQVSELSGGERAKLGLAMIMAKDCNLLLLDEPTNHLDLPSREALEEALRQYSGTVLFVSHDRYFVNSISSGVVELANGRLTTYAGNYDDFIARKRLAEQAASSSGKANDANKNTKAATTYRNSKQRAEETNRARRVKELEARITALEEEISRLDSELALPQVASDYGKVSDILQRQKELNELLTQAMDEWEMLA